MSTARALVSFVISLSNATKTVVSAPSETENWIRYLQKERHGQCVTWLVNTASHRQPKYLINVLSDRSPKDPNCFLMASFFFFILKHDKFNMWTMWIHVEAFLSSWALRARSEAPTICSINKQEVKHQPVQRKSTVCYHNIFKRIQVYRDDVLMEEEISFRFNLWDRVEEICINHNPLNCLRFHRWFVVCGFDAQNFTNNCTKRHCVCLSKKCIQSNQYFCYGPGKRGLVLASSISCS